MFVIWLMSSLAAAGVITDGICALFAWWTGVSSTAKQAWSASIVAGCCS